MYIQYSTSVAFAMQNVKAKSITGMTKCPIELSQNHLENSRADC